MCQVTPAIDIDVTIQPAAEAVERLAREMFGERGELLVRVGKAPKRAVLLRTDEPFEKLSQSFVAADGSSHKIEILGKGQQVIVDGTHPDTGRPYAWLYAQDELRPARQELELYILRGCDADGSPRRKTGGG